MNDVTRRHILGAGMVVAGTMAMPAILRAQTGPIKLGTLTPLTGSGGSYGPVMANTVKKAAEEITGRTQGWEYKIPTAKAQSILKRRADLIEAS